MVSGWLIAIAIIAAVLILGGVIYLLLVFQAEEDRTQAWFPKIVVVLGLSLACINVLMVPYDIANTKDPTVYGNAGGGIDTTVAWEVLMGILAVFVFVIVPFAMMYYEAMDPEQESIWHQIKPALISTTVVVIIFVVLLCALWATVGKAEISYESYQVGSQSYAPSSASLTYSSASTSKTLEIEVSFFVYLVALMSFFGWFIFSVFGGVGMSAMPIDFIKDFINRPKPITGSEYAAKKTEVAKESERLIDIGKKIDAEAAAGEKGRKHIKKVRAFKMQVNTLEKYYKKLEIEYKEKGGQILKSILKLVLGVFGAIISISWIFQIILYDAAKCTPCLNSLFVALDNAFGLLGIVAYAIFAFHLLGCVVKGCTRLGINLIAFTVYPMEVNGTMMNSFCFNTLLIMCTSVTVIQFTTMSFDQYAVDTSAQMLFSTYATHIKGLGKALHYFFYAFLVISFLALGWLVICPQRKLKDDEDLDDDDVE